jgi:uncharacterized protein YdcH (DUF465 family)
MPVAQGRTRSIGPAHAPPFHQQTEQERRVLTGLVEARNRVRFLTRQRAALTIFLARFRTQGKKRLETYASARARLEYVEKAKAAIDAIERDGPVQGTRNPEGLRVRFCNAYEQLQLTRKHFDQLLKTTESLDKALVAVEGQQAPNRALEWVEMAGQMIPVIGDVWQAVSALLGRELLTWRKLSTEEQLMLAAGAFLGGLFDWAAYEAKALRMLRNAPDDIARAMRVVEEMGRAGGRLEGYARFGRFIEQGAFQAEDVRRLLLSSRAFLPGEIDALEGILKFIGEKGMAALSQDQLTAVVAFSHKVFEIERARIVNEVIALKKSGGLTLEQEQMAELVEKMFDPPSNRPLSRPLDEVVMQTIANRLPFEVGQPVPLWPGGALEYLRTVDATYVAADDTFRYIDLRRIAEPGKPATIVNDADALRHVKTALDRKITQTGALVLDVTGQSPFQMDALKRATKRLLDRPEYASFERVVLWDGAAGDWVADVARPLTPAQVEIRLRMALMLVTGAAVRELAATGD